VPAGDAFTPEQLYDIERAVRHAEEASGLRFSVYVGGADSETRPFALELLNELPDPDHTVLVYVDPAGLAALAMQTSFATGDLTGGLVTGVQQLGQHAHQPTLLHANEPHQQ
jgi:hypothetical protein